MHSRYTFEKKLIGNHCNSNKQVRQKIMYPDNIYFVAEIKQNSDGPNDDICNSKKGVPEICMSVYDFKHSECKTHQAAQTGD